MYIMNRDGFSLLVMGFTGKDAFGEVYVKSQVDSIINERYFESHLKLKTIIQELLCDSIDDNLYGDGNEI
jgi:hypothetical protein